MLAAGRKEGMRVSTYSTVQPSQQSLPKREHSSSYGATTIPVKSLVSSQRFSTLRLAPSLAGVPSPFGTRFIVAQSQLI